MLKLVKKNLKDGPYCAIHHIASNFVRTFVNASFFIQNF